MSSTFPVKIICRCGRRLVPFFAATEQLRFLQRHGAPDDLLLATVKCANRECGQVHQIRLIQLSARIAA
jgi:hypothetical protein